MFQVLVIEDEEAIAELIEAALTHSGYTVTTALGGEEGLYYFERDFFDLVITDIIMPDVDGHAVAKHIRNSNRPDTPIISISGTPWLLKDHEFDTFLSKPFNLQALLETVASMMPDHIDSQKEMRA